MNKTSGKPKNGTLLYQLTDPRTAKEFAPLWDKTKNNWTVLDNVKAWTNEGGNAVSKDAALDAAVKLPIVDDTRRLC